MAGFISVLMTPGSGPAGEPWLPCPGFFGFRLRVWIPSFFILSGRLTYKAEHQGRCLGLLFCKMLYRSKVLINNKFLSVMIKYFIIKAQMSGLSISNLCFLRLLSTSTLSDLACDLFQFRITSESTDYFICLVGLLRRVMGLYLHRTARHRETRTWRSCLEWYSKLQYSYSSGEARALDRSAIEIGLH
jgi:hypothetical protein